MAQITFKFEQGEDIVIFANEGENLLEVAKKANLFNIPIRIGVNGGSLEKDILQKVLNILLSILNIMANC